MSPEHSERPNVKTQDSMHEPHAVPPPPYRPPLPPRDSSHLSPLPSGAQSPEQLEPPFLERSLYERDPRARSTDSLLPRESVYDQRKLLMVYVHGFMGDESSFKSFPAHIHYLVSHLIGDSIAVHTKIYPRYRSRRSIEYARDAFSAWLEPHESPDTDVILLSHSMGGLLAADVALLRPESPRDKQTYRHRILGLINFDVPFLGMHPGVVISGLGSIFRPSNKPPGVDANERKEPKPNEPHQRSTPTISDLGSPLTLSPVQSNSLRSVQSQPSSSGTTSPFKFLPPTTNDPKFNPRFENDVILPARKKWDGARYFLKKHSDDLAKATKALVTSHLEFGGTMADYPGLKNRYQKIRPLEDVDDSKPISIAEFRPPVRVRFVNYYTSSTGQIRPPKAKSAARLDSGNKSQQVLSVSPSADNLSISTGSRSPRIAVENPDGEVVEVLSPTDELEMDGLDLQDQDGGLKNEESVLEMAHMDPKPESDHGEAHDNQPSHENVNETAESFSKEGNSKEPHNVAEYPSDLYEGLNLPDIPPVSVQPEPFKPENYPDRDVRKVAEKEYARQLKAYTRSIKDRQKAIQERQKMVEKRQRRAEKERKKALKEEEKMKRRLEGGSESTTRLESEAGQQSQARPSNGKGEESSQQVISQTSFSNEQRASATSTIPTQTNSIEEPRGDLQQAEAIDVTELRRLSEELDTAKALQPKPNRKLKFCRVPGKDRNGQKDPTWIKVHMEGMDEVQAHCGLFLDDAQHYEKFVIDVGSKIAEWLEHANKVRERQN